MGYHVQLLRGRVAIPAEDGDFGLLSRMSRDRLWYPFGVFHRSCRMVLSLAARQFSGGTARPFRSFRGQCARAFSLALFSQRSRSMFYARPWLPEWADLGPTDRPSGK